MSATVAAALKKIAVALLTDKKALKTIGGIVLGVLIYLLVRPYKESGELEVKYSAK